MAHPQVPPYTQYDDLGFDMTPLERTRFAHVSELLYCSRNKVEFTKADAADQTAAPTTPQEEEQETTKYWFSTLPLQTSLEQFYEDAKQECGLDNYQGQCWDRLHRHLALVMLAYSFLMVQRLQLPLFAGEDFSLLSHAQFPALRALADPALALPGSRPLIHPDRSDQDLSPAQKLTK